MTLDKLTDAHGGSLLDGMDSPLELKSYIKAKAGLREDCGERHGNSEGLAVPGEFCIWQSWLLLEKAAAG